MKKIVVLGSGCKGCQTLYKNVIDVLAEKNIALDAEYITDMEKIMGYGVMSLPALVIDDKVESMGKVLSQSEVEKILSK